MIARKIAQARLEARWREQAELFPTMRQELPIERFVAVNIEYVMRHDVLQKYDRAR